MLIGMVVACVLLLAAVAALVWLARDRHEVRELIAAERGQPTAIALRRRLRRTVEREELSAALFAREALVDAVPLPVLVMGVDGTLLRVNSVARAELGGIDAGAPCESVSPDLKHALKGVLTGPPVTEVEIVAGPERRVWLAHLRSHPDGEERAAVAVLVDVSEAVDFRESRKLFSAAVSHELRTPLQRIVGLVDTLALPLTDAERADVVLDAEHEVERMRELVDEMLLLAALDRGEAALQEGETDAAECARGVVASRTARAGASEVTLELRAAPDLLVPISQRLLEVVLGNLLDNAIKHAGAGAHVVVEASGRAGEVEVTVNDNGIGIPLEHLPRVFERFFRGEASRSTAGAGLGLALVKHIVEAHGGRATVASRPGEGTTMRVLLPEVKLGRNVAR
jgi:two-component system, OmpR family, phosphate regulon sensor histidine kinase PhoR